MRIHQDQSSENKRVCSLSDGCVEILNNSDCLPDVDERLGKIIGKEICEIKKKKHLTEF